MRSISLFALLAILSQGLSAQISDRYGGTGFAIEAPLALVPFTQLELALIKANGIRTVVKEEGRAATVFHFNEHGWLVSEEYILEYRVKNKKYSETVYRYDSSGNLVLKKVDSPLFSYDSLSYDSSGQLLSFASFYSWDFGKPGDISWDWDLQFCGMESGKRTFEGTEHFGATFTLDSTGIFQTELDSFSRKQTGENSWIEEFWSRYPKDTVYRLERQYNFADGKLDKMYLHRYYTAKTDSILFFYDQHGRLTSKQSNDPWKTCFYAYNELNLKSIEVFIWKNEGYVSRYTYMTKEYYPQPLKRRRAKR